MKTSGRFRVGVYVGAAAVLLAAGLGLSRTRVWADLGLSSAIDVEIQDVENVDLLVYTPDAKVPKNLPVGVRTNIEPEELRGGVGVGDITSVVTELGGTLDSETGEVTDELDSVEASLVNESGNESEYLAVLNLGELDFETVSTGRLAEDVLRTVAIADEYYNRRDISSIAEADAIDVTVDIRDSADIDADGNGIPDATALLQRNFTVVGANGVITIVVALDDLKVRGSVETSVTQFYESTFGPVEITLDSPTLQALQIADDDFDQYDTARLIVSIANDAADLVDEPSGTSPVSEFDLEDGTDALPAPKNLFVRATIAVTTVSTRGQAAPDWTFVDDLPGGLDFVGTLSGPGIAEALENGTDVGVYTYGLTFSQDDEDIIATAGNDAQTDPWAEVDGLTLNNEDNADDDADSRIVEADDGDDTVRATFGLGSAIFASNIAPRADTGGGGGDDGGTCFIATAAYGTPMAAQIQSLREVRDNYLINNALGTAFVDAYYRISPPIAQVVSEHPVMKQGVRAALTPVVVLSRWVMDAPGALAAILIAALLTGSAAAARVRRFSKMRMKK